MREITESYLEKELSKAEKIIREKGSLKLRFFGEELEIPEFFLRQYERFTKAYELDDVNDIKQNYQTLSTGTELPYFSNVRRNMWGFRYVVPIVLMHKEEILRNGSEIKEYKYLVGINKETNGTPSFGNIDNIYFENLEFNRKHLFEACEFDVLDKYDDRIRGIFVYKNLAESKDLSDCMEMISNVVSSPERTPFDIHFKVLPEDDIFTEGSSSKRRGKQIYITRIYRSGREFKEDDVTAPSDSLTPSLVF